VEDLLGQEAEGCRLRELYRKMLPHLGVNRSIKAGWRHLHSTFGWIGLRKLLSKVIISPLNLFVQHHNTPSTLGQNSTSRCNAYNWKLDVMDARFQNPLSCLDN